MNENVNFSNAGFELTKILLNCIKTNIILGGGGTEQYTIQFRQNRGISLPFFGALLNIIDV